MASDKHPYAGGDNGWSSTKPRNSGATTSVFSSSATGPCRSAEAGYDLGEDSPVGRVGRAMQMIRGMMPSSGSSRG